MKKKLSVACMVATLIIFATTMLTGCEEITKEATEAEITATNKVTTIVVDSVIHDTLPGSIVRDTTWLHDSSQFTYILTQVHWMWSMNAGYLYGTDSIYLKKYGANGLCGSWQTTARHKGTVTLNVGTNPYPTSIVGDTLWLSAQGNGLFSGTIAGHYVSLTLGNQAMEPDPVIMDSKDWHDYLHPHEDAAGQFVVYDANGIARGRVIGLDGTIAGDVTAPYSTTDPEDTTRRLISADTAYSHLSTNPTGAWTGNTLKWSCVNRRTITEHYSSAPTLVTRDSNFLIYFPYSYSCTGSATPAMDGQTVNFSTSGVASWGGLTVTLTAQSRQCSIVPIPLPCQHSRTTATVHWNGGNPYVTMNGTLEGVATTATHTVPAESRHETGRDTAWNGCGSLVNSSITSVLIQHTLARTGVVTVNYNIAPLTYTYNISETTMYYSQYMVSGSANPSAIGTIANFAGNSVTIGGVTLVVTPGAQPWCNLNYTTATLTSNGIVVSFTYNGGTGTVTIQVPWNNPDPIFSSVLAAAATDSYTHQIFSQSSYRTTYVCVVAQIGSDYRFYWAELQAGLTRADFDSVSINATEANFYVNHLSDGYYPAMVYDHNNHTSLYRGVVKSVELTTGWQQTYRLAPSNNLAYVMGGSSWTMAGDNGRSAVRGVMNASGQILADGITVQLY